MSAQDWYARKLAQPQQPQGRQSPIPQYQRSYQQPSYQPPPPPPPPPSPPLNVSNFVEMMGRWEGGNGRTEKYPCPECGGPRFFQRMNTERGGWRRGPAPAAHCFDCGYSGGHLPQQGDPMSWGAA